MASMYTTAKNWCSVETSTVEDDTVDVAASKASLATVLLLYEHVP